MLKKSFLIIILSFVALAFRDGERDSMISQKHSYFRIDNLGNFLLINENEIMKYKQDGRYFNRYSNLKYGTITDVDATNSLRIMLYYKDYQQIIYLDSQMSQNSEAVSLEKLGLEQSSLACISANNGLWIFNAANNELTRFDEDLKVMVTSGNLKQILQEELKPNFMRESNGFIYLNVPDKGIYVFDIFGAFVRVISIKGLNEFSINENIIYYLQDNQFCSYNFKTFEEVCDSLTTPNLRQAEYFNGNIYFSNGEAVLN